MALGKRGLRPKVLFSPLLPTLPEELIFFRVLKNQETGSRAKTSNLNPIEAVQNLQSVIQRPEQASNAIEQLLLAH